LGGLEPDVRGIEAKSWKNKRIGKPRPSYFKEASTTHRGVLQEERGKMDSVKSISVFSK